MSDSDIAIVSAARTPIGSFLGSLSSLPGHQLGARVIEEVLARAQVQAEEVSEVIMGQVLVGGQGQNPARQAAFAAGVPFSVPAMGVSMVCGSGLKAVMLGRAAILAGDADIVVAGGQESMSRSAHALHMREGVKFGDKEIVDTMLRDGLTDAFNAYHMGITAENVAERWAVSRGEQDEFAAESQRKTAVAMEEGHFAKEIAAVAVKGRRGAVTEVKVDEYPKPGTTAEALAKLRPAFKTDGGGTVTAGNASGLNDGAAAVLLMSSALARRRNLAPLAVIVSTATVGISPEVMGSAPIQAVKKAVSNAGWTLSEVELFELNEAFAAQSVAIVKELGLDPAKVNVSGGAIALGHPIGASGCRVLVTLVHAMERLGAKKGCASLCIGGGMGVAVCVQRD